MAFTWSLTNENERLNKRLSAARGKARFADKRIAALEAHIAEQLAPQNSD
ncbi:hypothetical protein ACFWDI_12120 [Streptomyces sp. NPDC060064]